MVKLLAPFCMIIFVVSQPNHVSTTPVEEKNIDSQTPRAEYLQKWSQKFTQLNEIPKCKDVPNLSEEEEQISRRCSKTNKNLLCANIFLFKIIRNKCIPYFENTERLKQGIREIIAEKGLGTFATTPMIEIYEELEVKIGIQIRNFLNNDVADLVMDVLQEIALEQNDKPKAEYLQKWSQKFAELEEIPKCQDVPNISEEEEEISRKCPKTNKNPLCHNICLFKLVREFCASFFENKDRLKQSIREIVAEKGKEIIRTTPMTEIHKELHTKTGFQIRNFFSRDVDDLIMEVLQHGMVGREV